MRIITTASDIRTWITNTNPGNVLLDPALVEQLAEAIRTADDRPPWGEDWEEWLDARTESLLGDVIAANAHAEQAQGSYHITKSALRFTTAAQENIDETGCDPLQDVASIRSGTHTRESLLTHCLGGADDDRVQGWEEYVAAICDAAAS